VVDDEIDIRDMIRRHFMFLGYDVATATDGVDALKQMATKRFEVVISDITMPVMDGVQLLRAVREEYPMTRCIMITGYVTMENVLCCMRKGADTCVFKPIRDISELERAVEHAVDQLKQWQEKIKYLLAMKPSEDV
jgi:DNA-binding NtrC family response regulator